MIFDAIFDDMFDEIFGHLDESRACGDSRALLMPVQLDLKPNRRKYAMLKLLIGPLSLKWLAFCALWVVVFCNRAFFGHLLASYPLAEGHVYFLGAVAVLLFGLVLAELCILALVISARLAAIVLLLASSLLSFFTDQYGTVFDSVMVQNLFETQAAEAMNLMSLGLFLQALIFGLLPALGIALLRLSKTSLRAHLQPALGIGIGVGLALAAIAPATATFSSFFREHKALHYFTTPIYSVYGVAGYLKGVLSVDGDRVIMPSSSYAYIPTNDHAYDLVVLIVGETARADHFSLNGYARNTNPKLGRRPDVISFSQMTSCGTSTAVSVPCMFSYDKKSEFDQDSIFESMNVLDTLAKAGVDVLWRDNNSSSKHVADRVRYENYRDRALNTICDVECRDEGMLVGLQSWLTEAPNDKLIVLHQMGSHGPDYFHRYPAGFEQFQPACQTSELGDCSLDEITNAYDNSLLYTDHFIDKAIQLLEQNQGQYEVSLIYVSDHGESLGEQGLYLHGLPDLIAPEAQTHVPLLVWGGISSDIDLGATRKFKDLPFSHDDLPNVLLALFEVETDAFLDLPEPMIMIKPH